MAGPGRGLGADGAVVLAERPSHPLGCHNPRVADRDAMDAILLVLRTGMQWNALNATGICSSSWPIGGFRSGWRRAVFEAFWRQELLGCDELKGDRVGVAVVRWGDGEGAAWRREKTGAEDPDAQDPRSSSLVEFHDEVGLRRQPRGPFLPGRPLGYSPFDPPEYRGTTAAGALAAATKCAHSARAKRRGATVGPGTTQKVTPPSV